MVQEIDKIKKKLQNAFKLSGFKVRMDFCSLIIDKFLDNGTDVEQQLDEIVDELCKSLETQCLSEKSIELEHVNRAIEICLRSGYDQNETVFNVINAFNFPKLIYNQERKMYFLNEQKSNFLPNANVKAELFCQRYSTILQRIKRHFSDERIKLQSVDYLLTLSCVTLEKTLILGSFLQVSNGKYYLEDPTGMVQLDLTHTKYQKGFFVENLFVLVNGYYEDKILHVSSVILPPGEEYKNSRPSFGNLNYFGGLSPTPPKDSPKLKEHMVKNRGECMLIISDILLDNPIVFEKLETLFKGFQANPPIAFIIMGSFLSETQDNNSMLTLKDLFRKFGDLVSKYPNLVNDSYFVFVPSMTDPCTPHMLPRWQFPTSITKELTTTLPKAVFATNPCRVQYCTREIVLCRADIVPKLLQASFSKPAKDEIANSLARTIIGQGHLSPMSLSALPVHWDFDYCLRLYPLPDLVVIGDRNEAYLGEYKDCLVTNPGPFCENGFQFKSYTFFSNEVNDCVL